MTGFKIAATSDFFESDGRPKFEEFNPSALAERLDAKFEIIDCDDVVPEGSLETVDALVLLRPRITASSLKGADRLSLIARFGVGFERVDVSACTEAGVAVSITPDAVRRPVAVAELSLMLALAGRLTQKDSIVRRGPNAWPDRTSYNGIGLTGRTLGTVGLGNIARDLINLVAPLDMRVIGYDPYLASETDIPAYVQKIDFETVLRESDFLVINCPLTPSTKGLIGGPELALMKPSAFVINTARGGIVGEQALADALAAGTILGAGIAVFEEEPVPESNPLLSTPNVILSPHSIAWTDENFNGIGSSISRSVCAVREGRAPDELANPAILQNNIWLERLSKNCTATLA